MKLHFINSHFPSGNPAFQTVALFSTASSKFEERVGGLVFDFSTPPHHTSEQISLFTSRVFPWIHLYGQFYFTVYCFVQGALTVLPFLNKMVPRGAILFSNHCVYVCLSVSALCNLTLLLGRWSFSGRVLGWIAKRGGFYWWF